MIGYDLNNVLLRTRNVKFNLYNSHTILQLHKGYAKLFRALCSILRVLWIPTIIFLIQ